MKKGSILFFISFIFGISETLYFGSNWLPASNAEFICDFIATVLCASGITISLTSAFKHKTKTEIPIEDSLKKLLNYMLQDLNWDYKSLNQEEKKLLTRAEFNAIKKKYKV